MALKRRVEIYSAGCPLCLETIEMVKSIACPSCEVTILDMNDPEVAKKARGYGIRTLPAVVIDGKLSDCCFAIGPSEAILKAEGLGRMIAQ